MGNSETNTEIILEHVEGNRFSLIKNGRARDAELVVKDYIRMMSNYMIKVVRDAENTVVGLNVEKDRIKNVIFTKTP